MKKYMKPMAVIEQFETNGFIAACGTTITSIPQQNIACIATCTTENVFGAGKCQNTATIVTTRASNNGVSSYFYKNSNGAATDIYNGALGDSKPKNDVPFSTSETSEYPYEVSVGTQYVVWTAAADNGDTAYHANTYATLTETIKKS